MWPVPWHHWHQRHVVEHIASWCNMTRIQNGWSSSGTNIHQQTWLGFQDKICFPRCMSPFLFFCISQKKEERQAASNSILPPKNIKSGHCSPKNSGYFACICACRRAGEWEQALHLLNDAWSKDLEPTVECYSHVIRAIGTGDQQQKKLLDELRNWGPAPTATGATVWFVMFKDVLGIFRDHLLSLAVLNMFYYCPTFFSRGGMIINWTNSF